MCIVEVCVCVVEACVLLKGVCVLSEVARECYSRYFPTYFGVLYFSAAIELDLYVLKVFAGAAGIFVMNPILEIIVP